ncbi:hypothetical protein F0562_000182 [Nyssa sinensis]|uniref:S-adenosylmethionine decarboxylase proenzyme n=1 Tax=Nyssa sinensis TaxID=561372 RepID=A0A5J5C4M4_9ASTE|nr:hypothetical protein F0562_000182 [Nyssa sinensis]
MAVSGFEGFEKRLELHFSGDDPVIGIGLRQLDFESLEQVLHAVQCTVVSAVGNQFFDSYVLSESSLFVYPTKIIIKTCGTTQLLKSIRPLIHFACNMGLNLCMCRYTRGSFIFPKSQPYPHTSFREEVIYLEDTLPQHLSYRKASVMPSKFSSHSWHVFSAMAAQPISLADELYTIEVCMTELDCVLARKFFRRPNDGKSGDSAGREMTEITGIGDINPNALICDFAFDPCGYSMNGIDGDRYSTIHVTPEDGYSYASFECVGSIYDDHDDIVQMLKKVVQVFRPATMSVSTTCSSHEVWTRVAGAIEPLGLKCRSCAMDDFPAAGRIDLLAYRNMGCCRGKRRSRQPPSSDGHNGQSSIYQGHGKHILANRSIDIVPIPAHNFRLEYTVLTQRGYYPDYPDKENEDNFCIRTNIQGNPNVHFFGVFDGHGRFGAQCSNFVKNKLVEILSNDPKLLEDPGKAQKSAFLATNDELQNSDIDDWMSGTTAITVLVVGDMLYVANAGDSRAVIGVRDGNRTVAKDLSNDQTPFRRDEYERVKLCGARILNIGQAEGEVDPEIQTWDDERFRYDPPRVWLQDEWDPGAAFTRSIGDRQAETVGVVADPEVSMHRLRPDQPFFILASDGVFQFLSSQTVVDLVASYADPRDASSVIAAESYKLWLDNDIRTDDITIVIVQIKGLSNWDFNG